MTELDRHTTTAFTDAVASELERLGLARLRRAAWMDDRDKPWSSRFWDVYHHIGTTRMGADEKHGVVDENCAVYGCRGLYVARSTAAPRAAPCARLRRRGTNAASGASAPAAPWTTVWSQWRAGYSPQTLNGDGRPAWYPRVRS